MRQNDNLFRGNDNSQETGIIQLNRRPIIILDKAAPPAQPSNLLNLDLFLVESMRFVTKCDISLDSSFIKLKIFTPMTLNWFPFASLAGKYLIEYSLPPVIYHLGDVKRFLITHSAELYLKATYIKMTNKVDEAIALGHHIPSLIDKCKLHDPNFLSQYEIKENILDVAKAHTVKTKGYAGDKITKSLSREDAMHFIKNEFLYSAALFQADLKYWGTPAKNKSSYSGTLAWGYSYPDSQWIDFIKVIREFLFLESLGHDYIREYLNMDNISIESRRILNNLYNIN